MTTHSQTMPIESTAGASDLDERKLKSLAGLLNKRNTTRRAALEEKFAAEIYPLPPERAAAYYAERHPGSAPRQFSPAGPPAETTPDAHPAPTLAEARRWCLQMEIDRAAEAYQLLMKQPKDLANVIADLESLVPHLPGIWQLAELLGDAYLRANRLGPALRAYRRALHRLAERTQQ